MKSEIETPYPVLDTHHHLWKIERGDYGWMSPDLTVLYRDYMPEDLAPLLRQAGVKRTILVQAAGHRGGNRVPFGHRQRM